MAAKDIEIEHSYHYGDGVGRALCAAVEHHGYASWQKGGIENANGRLRRWLPRQTNLDDISDEDMQEIVMTYNLTPRKCLGYITPIQALFKDLGRDVRPRFA